MKAENRWWLRIANAKRKEKRILKTQEAPTVAEYIELNGTYLHTLSGDEPDCPLKEEFQPVKKIKL